MTFEELSKKYPLSKPSHNTMRNYFDKLEKWIPEKERPKKEEPKPEEEKETSLLDDAIELGKLGLTQGMMLPNFLGGLAAETAGNVLQGLGNLQRNSLAGQYAPEVADLLQNLGEGATGVAETMANTGTLIPHISYNPDPTEDTPSKFINQTNSAYTGALGNVARFLHADKVADAYGNKANELRVKDEERPAPDFTLDYLFSGLPVDFGELTGSMAAIAPAMAALPESAVAGMLNPIAREMINRGMYGAAKVFSQLAPNAVRYGLTSAPLEGIMEGGQTRENLLAQGYSDEEATKQSAITALKNMALLLPTNTLEGLAMFSPLARAGKFATAGQIGGRGLLNTAQESYEEFAQEGIQNAAEGKPYSYNPFNGADNQYEAAKHVAGPAALMGLIGGGFGAYRNRNATNEQRENQQNWNRGSQENISANDYGKRAEKQGRQSQYDNLRSWANKISGGKMSDDVFDSIVRNAKIQGVPIKIALAQATAESNGDQNVTSEAGAIGVMQLMPETAEGLGVDPYDQEQNIRGGMKYLKDMYDQFGDWNLALAAYNAGAGAVQKYGGIPNYSETQNYVAKINGFLDESPYYEGAGDRDVRSEGTTYLGDGGKGEGSTWQKQNDNVSLDRAQPDLLNAIDVLGKWFYDRTGKRLIVTSGDDGDHTKSEHDHYNGWKVDVNDWDGESDGYLVTADGSKGSLTDEFIKFGQSIGLGMNWEGDHIDVALDGNQWADENGNALDTPQNFGGFNPRKTANNQSSIQPSQQQQQPTTPKPLFDINREDDQAQDIFAQFAEEKYLNGLEKNNNDEVDFFSGMFDTDGKFQSTKENRDAIRQNFTDEFTAFAQNAMPKEQPTAQPKQSQSQYIQQSQPKNPLLVNDNLRDVMINYLDSIDRNAPENSGFALEIEKAFNDGKQEKVKSMLESRGVSTTSQADPVTQNKPPENILPTPKKLSGQEKMIRDASAPVIEGKKGNKKRKTQGKALVNLAIQNKVEIPAAEVIALQNGSTKAVQKWHDELSKRGLFNTAQPQAQAQQVEPQRQDNSAAILKAREAYDNRKNKAMAVARNLMNMSETDESFVKHKSPNQSRTQLEPWEDLSEWSREHDITGTAYEKELQQRQAEEERHRQWKAKQDRELEELKARQAENKRLAEVRRKMDEEKVARQAAEEKQQQIENIQSILGNQDTELQRQITFALSEPSTNKQNRERQGNALLDLLERPQIKYAISDNGIVNSLKPSLKVGGKPAILKAQEILNELEAPEQRENRPVGEIRQTKSPIQLEQERRQREQKKQQRQWELAQRQEKENQRLQKIIERADFDDELQFEDEMQESKLWRQGDLDYTFELAERDEDRRAAKGRADNQAQDRRQRELWETELADEEEEVVGNLDYARDQRYLEEEEDENIENFLSLEKDNARRHAYWEGIEQKKQKLKQTIKAIEDAPDGTKIRGKWIGFGETSESQYIIQNGKLQRLDENGYRDGKAVKLSPENIRKNFGQYSLSELELIYPENKSSTEESQPANQTEPKKTAKSKWHTIIGNANSREDLQKLIREKLSGAPLTIQEDGSVVHEETGEILSGIARNNKGRWQYGKYEENTETKPKAESEQETEPKVQDNSREEYDKQLTNKKGEIHDVTNSPTNIDSKETTANEQQESGESTRLDDGHRNGESEVRSATGETAREERRVENSGRDSGQQRQDAQESGEDITGTNAENERPIQEGGAGKTSTRTGERTGTRGDSGAVQSDEQDGRAVHDDGRGQSGIHETAKTVKHETAGHNFHIAKEHGIGEGGLKTKFKQNIDAIKLLKQIESEGRMATPSEQEILAKFNGWGTIASVFSNDPKWQKEQAQLKELLTPEEYEAASAAQTNAFYTSPEIAEAIWQGVTRMGFKGGRILDPSTGSGIFFGTIPVELAPKSTLVGTELDSLTGRIAKQLYQKADIEITGYQNRVLPNNYFDLAISNVPFANVKILEDPAYRKDAFALHDYFFAKSIDKVRPGGLVVFITSTGTLNSDVAKLYAKLDKQADLVAAFKLPSNTFDKNAGTQVTTDIVIFQKRLDPHKPAEYAQEWGKIFYQRYDIDGKSCWFDTNQYFVEHPEHMIGEPIEDRLLYSRGDRLALDGKGRDVVKELSNLMNKLPENISAPIKNAVPIPNKIVLVAPSTQQDGTFTAQDGKIFQKQNEKLVEITGKDLEPTRNYIHLLGTLDALLKSQLDPAATEEKVSGLRSLLNQKYNDFVRNYGYINSPTNAKRFISDPNYGRLAAIENYKPARKKGEKESVSKAAIFSKRTVEPNKIPSSADTAVDALSLSLAMRGQVDMDYISDLTGKNEPEIVKELGDLIYRNPATNLHELSEEYLSGNVREKLAEAKEAARTNPEYKRNIAALEKVQPADLTEHDIAPHLGAPWIKPEYYEAFIKNILNHNVYDVAVNYSPTTGEWTVEGRTTYDSEHYKWQVSGTKWNFLNLLEAAMNKKSPTVTKDKKIDEAKTNEAREKIAQLKEEFKKWIWADEARKKDLLETYNVEFNSEILRDYENGASLTFPGLAQDVKEKLYPHQRNVIWRILQGKNTMIAHCVGAGKTWSMQIAAMEMKRLGIIKKPLFVVPTNILKQFEREFRAAYPSANLLTLTAADLVAPKVDISFDEKLDTTGRSKTPKSAVKTNEKESLYQRQERLLARRKALSKIATGDWDGIIISHDMFLRLPMSPETYNEFYREQKALLKEEKRNQYGDKAGDKKHTKLLENAIASLEQKLARDINEEKKEIVMPFEELGIDQIFVDEADMFKNLGFNTHYNSSRGERVSGISTTNAQRSLDMYIKTKWLSKIRNGGGVVFATGTPISNTLNEIYTMQRYLDYFMLQDKKIYQFDNWAGMFAEEVKSTEADPSGNGFREVTRLKLTNLQTLIGMFRKFADIKMAEDLPHLTRPKLKNDSRTVVQIESTNAFKDFKKELLVRAKAIRDGHIDPREDNYLKIISDFRKASLDMRLIDPSISESEAGGKIDAICSAVVAKYKETANVKGAQLIFSDLSVPKSKDENAEEISDEQAALEEETALDDISVYERIKKGLIKRGIPANQIAFVHEAKNANQRQALFDRVNNGDVRVIIGSTSKMGAGTNFQKHLVALHHLDCPWRPRDIEQREGRILRSGNDNAEVEIFTYVTKGSYDANMWEKVSIKQSMIDAVLRGDPNIKELEDVSEMSASYEDIASTAYENPLMSEEAKLSAQLRRLRYSKNLFAQQQRQKNSEQKNLTKQIPQIEKQIADLNADIALKTDTKGDAFKMKIGGTTYTKRAEAAKVFDELIQNFSKESSTKVGEIGGFDIKMRAEHTMAQRGSAIEVISTRVYVQLANNGTYSAEDSLKSIEHFISHGGIETALKYAEKNLKATKAKLDAVNEELAKPFSKQAELDETEKRLQEVRAQISAANSDSAESETPTEQSEEELPSKESNSKEKDDWFKRHVIIARVPNNESKSSQQGSEVDTTIKNYVDPKDLTPQQKLLQDFGRKLGTRVIFFNNGDGRFHGQHSNGITYLNVVSNMPLGKVFWHESMHWLKANNPKLYQQLVKAAEITDEQRQAYLERTERNDLKTDEAIDEEIIADQFEDVAKRSGLLQSISGKNRGLIQRVIQWLQDTMKKFIEHFRNPQGKLTTAQSQALADEFGKIAKDLVDPNGEQIFRYNRRTHNVELANGRDWDSSTEHSDNRGAFNSQPKYSIDASDNSNESTLQRIRNKVSAFFNPPPKSRNKRIKQLLEKLADIRIVAGHIKGAKLINVDEFHRLLHTRKAYDWENILPEIGGMLAKSLNIQDSDAMRNYVTDWLLTGAPNNNSAEAKIFQQAARNNPAMFEILQKIRDEFDEFNNLSGMEQYEEGIVDNDKTLGEKLGYYKENWREEFTDDLHPIERMFNQVVAKAEKTNPKLAEWLKESVNSYELARLVRGKGAVADILVGKVGSSPSKKINEIRATLAEAYPNVNFSNFKPITMILEEVGALEDKKKQRQFESFCVAKLDKEMYEKIRSDPEKYKGITPFRSEAKADEVIAQYEKEFGQAQRDLVHYSNVLITMRYDAGLMSKSKYNEILSGWQNYIPTARVFEENEDYDFVDSLKQKTGSHRDIRTPIQKLIDNTNSLVKQAERNKVKCQVAQLARCGQFGQIIAVTENSKPNLDNTVLFYEHGKKCWLETPDLSVVRALNSIQSQKDGAWIVKAFNAAMSFFRSMLTNLNLDFAAGNAFRDSAAAYIHNKHLGYANPFMFFADVARIGFKGFWTKDSNWLEWQTFGGSQASFVSQDVDYVQRSISNITETGWESFKKHPLSYILDKMQYVAEMSETATRLTTYVRARDALAKQRADGKATIDDKRRAALMSRNATIDFSRAGTSTRKANRVFAFANAAVQDWALQAQTFSPAQIQKVINGNKQAQQQIFSAAFRLILMGIVPTLLQFALMHRDDDKKKQYKNLHDWEKETYWYLGDTFHIPKSMDIGIRLTSAITDEFLKTAIDKDPAEWKRFRRLILDAAPGLTATLATPAVEAWANYSFFRDAPIVPGKEQHLPGNLQYGHDTSPAAKFISDNTLTIAKIFGAETGFSPRKIDYMISGYLGFMGRFFSGGTDELPIVRRFLYEPYKNPKIVKDYYEAFNEQESLYNGYKLELQKDRKTKPPKDFDPKLYGRLKSAQKTMQNLSKHEKQILDDEKLSESQRKEKLRELELRRIEICERVFNKAR